MTYSNTNKDKEQINIMEVLKRTIIWTLGLTIIVWSLVNIRKQFVTLKLALEKNSELEGNINITKQELLKLKAKTEYATSSAGVERRKREILGEGGVNDFWIKIPEDTLKVSKDETGTTEEELPNLWRWIRLFTNL